MNNLKLSGLLYFLAGSIVLMGIITAEAMYPPGYTTFKNEISDLGATRQPNSISCEPSSGIFNTVMLLAGIMVLIASFYQHKHFRKLLFTIPVILFGFGLAGVGIFPGNKTPYHGMSAMLAFLSGGFCAITSFKIVTPPFKYISIVFGSVALLTWFLAVFAPATLISVIGIGGTERWVAYPIMLWLTENEMRNLKVGEDAEDEKELKREIEEKEAEENSGHHENNTSDILNAQQFLAPFNLKAFRCQIFNDQQALINEQDRYKKYFLCVS